MNKILRLIRSGERFASSGVHHLIRPLSRLQPLDFCLQSVTMTESMRLEQAYPKIRFRWRSRNWWARLTRTPPECEHLENDGAWMATFIDRKSTRLNSSHSQISYAVFCLKKKKKENNT